MSSTELALQLDRMSGPERRLLIYAALDAEIRAISAEMAREKRAGRGSAPYWTHLWTSRGHVERALAQCMASMTAAARVRGELEPEPQRKRGSR